MRSRGTAKAILVKELAPKHVEALLVHYDELLRKYKESNWESCLIKAGKFIEAVIKALYIYCGKTLPRPRKFKVSVCIEDMRNLSGQFDDVVCILVPRACSFVYDVASNRGSRHDPSEIDSNEMDAAVCIEACSWILAELIRHADAGNVSPVEAMKLVQELTKKRYPHFEEIDGRVYVNMSGLSAKEIGLLLLYECYPSRISRQGLMELIWRNGVTKEAAAVATSRLVGFIDDRDGDWKLRSIGRIQAEKILGNSS
jgi:hypothetical protein